MKRLHFYPLQFVLLSFTLVFMLGWGLSHLQMQHRIQQIFTETVEPELLKLSVNKLSPTSTLLIEDAKRHSIERFYAQMDLHSLFVESAQVIPLKEGQGLSINLHYRFASLAMFSFATTLLLFFLDRILGRPLPGCSKRLQIFCEQNAILPRQLHAVFGKQCPSPQQQALITIFRESDIGIEESLRMVKQAEVPLNNKQIEWLKLALQQGQAPQEAFKTATSPDTLGFDLNAGKIYLRCLEFEFSRTPLFYLYWYARRKHLGGESAGWVLNPHRNLTDLQEGEELAELMESSGGHLRAINELRNQGLKAKTLDQNRSKIKEELNRHLGEKLAEDFLFLSRLDPRSGRKEYQIILPAEQIQLSPLR